MLLTRSVNIPICLEVGKGIAKEIRGILTSHNLSFPKVVLVSTKHLCRKYKNYLGLNTTEEIFIERSDEKNVAAVKQRLGKYTRDILVVAFGGGKVIDVAKYAATGLSMNYLSVPTTLSSDGIYSPVAVISDSTGRKKSLGANVPLGIVIDLDLVRTAPRETVVAGVGDLVSNVSALEDWKLAKKNKIEPIDDFAYTISYLAADSILDSEFSDVFDYGFLKNLAYALVTAGLSMEIAGSSRPCSGSEHMFSHAIDYLYLEKARLHGIQVAFGTLLMEAWRGNDTRSLETFFKKVGLPTTIAELGLPQDNVKKALLYARKIRDRYTILNKRKPTAPAAEKLLTRFC